MKFINPRVHGYLDYALVALFALAPTLFGFGGIAEGAVDIAKILVAIFAVIAVVLAILGVLAYRKVT